eukprot:TRINITY_DN74594_c0_g1_i1.p1 TRINITY_DN74594_c0_g1~~TRINITY_DN74594_c0_g1_i1.p1  ORF type:complete len:738 (-),score=173.33 TRINITY_DN74594_c0_g1_i1:42-2183(-)
MAACVSQPALALQRGVKSSEELAASVSSEELLGRRLRSALAEMERAVLHEAQKWLGLERWEPSRPSSAGALRAERGSRQERNRPFSPRQFDVFVKDARNFVQEHCEAHAKAKIAAQRKRLAQRIEAHLSELVELRDKFAPQARDVSCACSEEEERELHKPLDRWPEVERRAMKVVIHERVLQLLAKHMGPSALSDTETETESELAASQSDSDLDVDVQRGLRQLKRTEAEVPKPAATPAAAVPRTKKKGPPRLDPQAEADLENRRQELEKLRRELAEWRKRAEVAEAEVANLKRKIAELDAEKARLTKLIKAAQMELSATEAALQDAQDRDEARAARNEAALAAARKKADEVRRAEAEARETAKLRRQAVAETAAKAEAAAAEATAVPIYEEEIVYEDDLEALAAAEAAARANAAEAVAAIEKSWEEQKAKLLATISQLEAEIARLQALLKAQQQREAQNKRTTLGANPSPPSEAAMLSTPTVESPSGSPTGSIIRSVAGSFRAFDPLQGIDVTYTIAAKQLSNRVWTRLEQDIKDRRERSEHRFAQSMSERELYWTHRLRSGSSSLEDQAPIIGIQPRGSSPEPDDPPPREAKLRIRLQGPLPMLEESSADKYLQAGIMPSMPSSRLGSARRSTSLTAREGGAVKPSRLDDQAEVEPALKQLLSTGRLPTSEAGFGCIGPTLFRSFTPVTHLSGGDTGWVPERQKADPSYMH